MKVLFHVAEDLDGNPLTAVFIDGNGKRYTVPAFEPTEIESDFMALKVMEHCHYYGIVEVNQIRTGRSIDFDVDDATKRAAQALELSEKNCINDYVKTQLESRVKMNVPPLPPEGRSLECVVKHKYNLLRAGIRPVGWEPPYHVDEPEQNKAGTYAIGGTEIESRIRQLEKDNEELRVMVRKFQQAGVLDKLAPGKVKAANTKKAKEAEAEEAEAEDNDVQTVTA